MSGYIKIKAIDFDTWNNAATVKANKNDLVCDQYTYCIPDKDPAYVWIRVEHYYITNEPLVSYENAILQGMVINDN